MNPRLAAIAARAQLELEQPGATSAGTHEQTISSEVLDHARQQARHALRDLDSRVAYVASRAKTPPEPLLPIEHHGGGRIIGIR